MEQWTGTVFGKHSFDVNFANMEGEGPESYAAANHQGEEL